jgi:hypothetical protein
MANSTLKELSLRVVRMGVRWSRISIKNFQYQPLSPCCGLRYADISVIRKDHPVVRSSIATAPMTCPLDALVKIISSQVDTLKSAYFKDGGSFPSIDDPFVPTPLDGDPIVREAKQLIVAAAAQLIATVRSPVEVLREAAPAMYTSAALGFVEETNIVDILFEAGREVCVLIFRIVHRLNKRQGLHINGISAISGVEASYLGEYFSPSLLLLVPSFNMIMPKLEFCVTLPRGISSKRLCQTYSQTTAFLHL